MSLVKKLAGQIMRCLAVVGMPCLPRQHTWSPRLDCRACARRMQPSFSSPFQAMLKVANVVFFVNADASCPAPAACRQSSEHPSTASYVYQKTAKHQGADLPVYAKWQSRELQFTRHKRGETRPGWLARIRRGIFETSNLFSLDVIWVRAGMSGT
jgi:hypothetical protein